MSTARRQNGVITLEQLRAAGLTRGAIRARLARGRLVPLFRGVYALGDPELMPLARATGAVLSLGPTALVSHRSAAALLGLAEADEQTVDITVVGCSRRARAGIRLHRVRALDRRDVTRRANLALTSAARTLIDFAADASSSELGDAFAEARAKRLVTDGRLHGALRRAPSNHVGAAVVRAMLREGGTYDRSKAEQLMRRHLHVAELPQPQANVMLGGHLVDFLWPDEGLIVEVDGYSTHGNRQAFEADRRRDQAYVAAGYVVVRVTWWQLQREPMAVIARIAQALAHRAQAA